MAFKEEHFVSNVLRDHLLKNPKERVKIEEFIHPLIPDYFHAFLRAKKDIKVIFLQIPLLFEKGLEHSVDTHICIYASEEDQLKRLINKRHFT